MTEVMAEFSCSISDIFSEFDSDHAGYLTLDQLHDCLQAMGIYDTAALNLTKYTTTDPPTFTVQQLTHIIQLPLTQPAADATNDDVMGIFASIDTNGDGRISAADFEVFLRANGGTINSAAVREMISEVSVSTTTNRPNSREQQYLCRDDFVAAMR